jgi:hypothetical protein
MAREVMNDKMLTDTLNSAMESGADWDDINEYLTDDN